MMDTHPGFIATSYIQYDTHICFIKSDVLLEARFNLNKEYHHHHHWLDSPWWALTFLRSFAHSSLLRATFFQFLASVLIS